MNTSIIRQNVATQDTESAIHAYDWALPIWGWPQAETDSDVPEIADPIDFGSSFDSSEDGHVAHLDAVHETHSEANTRSDDADNGWPLLTTSASRDRVEPTLHAVRIFGDDPVSASASGSTWAPQVSVLQQTPITQSRNGGIFGLDGDSHVVGTEWDDVFYEAKYYADENMPDGWATQRQTFQGRDGDDIFYTVDGLGYRGQNTDFGLDIFNGGRGTDTVSYIRAYTGAAINLEEGIGYRFGQNWTHPNKDLVERDSLVSIENATGSQHADRIRGDWKDNVLHGLDGDDVMWGGLGDDTMHGGSGDDAMRGEDHDDLMFGDEGNDSLWGSVGDDTIHGGEGDDDISGGAGDDSILGDAGDDELYGHDGADTIRAGEGDDTIRGGSGDDELHGNGGENDIRGGRGFDQITLGSGGSAWGEQGDDLIHGSNARDFISGGDHDDDLFGWGGNDEMSGGAGDDHIDGGAGFDTASYMDASGAVSVFLSFDGGFASGGAGNDQLFSIESVVGSAFGDVISGNDALNTLLGGSGNDIIAGNGGTDIIYGQAGDDDLRGGTGGDIMFGGDGRDQANGGSGDDDISGGAGNDAIRGGDGLDDLTGGEGSDSFVFVGGDTGADTITDFELGIDRIVFDDFLANPPGLGESYQGEVYAFFADQPGDSTLMARTTDGWLHVATFEGIGANALSDAIADRSLFIGSVEVVGEGPGGWAPVEGDPLPLSPGDELLFG
ncbi:calcium-binding protein [Roseobacter sinensis]|uniref:Type I secretion target repeat protein n=1 Tax=Roseobacter sinensis TaxID=2931391 RepID=A0ABT3BJV8_9RHOB|nr:calcium-binding protein [Roseobacter sp. WL0113]MCV3273872.1 hypothetical protein [Roseobacter sp. WL0113]